MVSACNYDRLVAGIEAVREGVFHPLTEICALLAMDRDAVGKGEAKGRTVSEGHPGVRLRGVRAGKIEAHIDRQLGVVGEAVFDERRIQASRFGFRERRDQPRLHAPRYGGLGKDNQRTPRHERVLQGAAVEGCILRITLTSASMARSTSASDVSLPTDSLTAARAVAAGSPMAVNTGLGSRAPPVQAEPADAYTPSRSRFANSISPSTGSPSMGGKATFTIWGATSRSVTGVLIQARPPSACRIPSMSRSRRAVA